MSREWRLLASQLSGLLECSRVLWRNKEFRDWAFLRNSLFELLVE